MAPTDAKLIGRVYSLLLEHGAISTPRAQYLLNEETKELRIQHFYQERDLHWAFYQLDCKEGGGLWTLPPRMLPMNEKIELERETIRY